MAPRPRISRPNPTTLPWLQPLTPWEKFRRDPTNFLARWLYKTQPNKPTFDSCRRSNSTVSTVTVVCISDTHCTQPDVPNGHVLLHAGDLTNSGSFNELQAQLDWINTLPHTYKIVIGGNHDSLLDPDYVDRFPDRIHEGEGTSRGDLRWGNITYLNKTSTKLTFDTGTLSVYGSPWTPQFGTFAFQYPRISKVWANTIPDDTDIIVTHGPPRGHLDLQNTGCPQLLKEIRRVQPRLAVFGHIHAGRGRDVLTYDGIGRAYDSVMAGEKRWGSIVAMAILTACAWICSMSLSLVRVTSLAQTKRATVLVNAAVVGGLSNNEVHEATVVRI